MECPNCDGKKLSVCCGVPMPNKTCSKCGLFCLNQCSNCVVANDPSRVEDSDSTTQEPDDNTIKNIEIPPIV